MTRAKVNQVLDGTKAFHLLLRMRSSLPSPWLTVVTYHRVADPAIAAELDSEVVDARPATFERQMRFLKEHCSVIGLDELRRFKNGGALPPNPVLVTFDDGYRDNHDVALPVLSRLGIPAVFFVATSYVEERRLFWWDRVCLVMKRSPRPFVELEYPHHLTLDLRDRTKAAHRAMHVIKSHFDLDLPRFLEELERAAGVSISREEERELAHRHVMTWDQVRALRDAGMSVQSHTRTHRVLHTLDDASLQRELVGSRRELEEVLDERVTSVAYPVGKGLLRAPHARNAIRAAGYEMGFTNGTGINHVWSFDRIDVRRLSVEIDIPDAYFHAMMAFPYLAYEHEAGRGWVLGSG